VRLEVVGEPLDDHASLDALAELAIAQLFHLIMIGCQLSPASLPALTRLLRSGALAELEIVNSDTPMLAGEGVPAFCAAPCSWAAVYRADTVVATLAARAMRCCATHNT
jgi:hypothetical protein